MKSNKKYSTKGESLDVLEDEDEGFFEGELDLGKTIKAFSFGGSTAETQPALVKPAVFSFTSSSSDSASSINGEAFSIKRGYQFRPSTLRKLSEIKAKHPDVNVYISTILDEAINFYHQHVLSNQQS